MEKCLQCGREKWDPFGGDSALSRCVRSGDRSCFAVKLALAADRARIAAAILLECERFPEASAPRAAFACLLRVVEGG